MIITFFVYLSVFSYLFSGLIAWLALVRDITRSPEFSCWHNILILFVSAIVIFAWPIWVIIEAKKQDSEEIAPEVA
ncbi:hypothetical protein ABN584_17480 [Gloeocapsa sp. BRSZ]